MKKDNKDNFYLAGKMLLAMPMLGDPRFHKAVIFICAHDENGAMGLVVNNTLAGFDMDQLLEQVGIAPGERNLESINFPVMAGGPVESARGFLLHDESFIQKDTIRIDQFGITGTIDALKEIATGNGPDDLLFILGYAGWSPGQLDEEIQQNSWLVADADPAIIFHANPDEKWNMAVRKMGIEPAMLSAEAGRA